MKSFVAGIKESFTKNTFKHDLIEVHKKNKDTAFTVYSRKTIVSPLNEPAHFEVVILRYMPVPEKWKQTNPEKYKDIDFTWQYPSSELWGKQGWTYRHDQKSEAMEKYNSLVNNTIKKSTRGRKKGG